MQVSIKSKVFFLFVGKKTITIGIRIKNQWLETYIDLRKGRQKINTRKLKKGSYSFD